MTVSYYWHEFIDNPDLKKYLVMQRRDRYYDLVDLRNGRKVLTSTMDLSEYLKHEDSKPTGK
jgi:hypothetical protein